MIHKHHWTKWKFVRQALGAILRRHCKAKGCYDSEHKPYRGPR